MSNTTKLALEASLKKLLLKKPVDKITINDLTEDCGISRMAFYYHFKDIYDLIEWACLEDGKRALADKKTYSTWSEGLEQIFDAALDRRRHEGGLQRTCAAAEHDATRQYLKRRPEF